MIVITMAGESNRFKEAGIRLPKWALNVGNMSILSRSLESVKNVTLPNERIVLVLRNSHREFLKDALQQVNIENLELVFLNMKTSGQAESLKLGLAEIHFDSRERLIVWCADAYILLESIIADNKPQNRIYVSRMEGTQWSFAKIENGTVIETAEKNRISEFASIGLYEFESISTFLELDLVTQANQTEVYIAPLYNQLITMGKKIGYYEIRPQDYFSFGTPAELRASAQRLGISLNKLEL